MIALIPARGGSKGLPGKNIKILGDKPLIAYTILAAREAKCIDRIIVTTDDEQIAEVAREYGAEVPFMRPKELATDTSAAPDVYVHAISFLSKEMGKQIDKFMVLLPTAPFRTAKHIDEAYALFLKSKCTTLVSVKKADIPPSWYLSYDEKGRVHACDFGRTIQETNNRQLARDYYHCNGAIYILDYELLKIEKTYFCEDTIGYIMDHEHSVDVDTMEDFAYAQYRLNCMEKI